MGKKFIVEEVEEKKGCLGTVGSVLLFLLAIAILSPRKDKDSSTVDKTNSVSEKKKSTSIIKSDAAKRDKGTLCVESLSAQGDDAAEQLEPTSLEKEDFSEKDEIKVQEVEPIQDAPQEFESRITNNEQNS